MIPASSRPRVAVVGGSLGGLMAALALREVGCEVDVYERVPQRLEGQGAGLRIVPEMARLLGARAGIDLAPASIFVRKFRHIGEGDRIVAEKETPGQFTSWGALHRALAAGFDPARYHLGETCVGAEPRADGCYLVFAGGRRARVDLAVFADGILSTGRRLLAPEAQPVYAGYVAWRGYLPAEELKPETRVLLEDGVNHCVLPYSHTTIYPIPDPVRDTSRRFFNFVWYRNVAAGPELDALMTGRDGVRRPISLLAGAVQERFMRAMKEDAARLMPPAGAEPILKTKEPFVQALFDVEPSRMVLGSACLIGDAAFATRPHAGAATTKAAVNAWRLADYLVQF
ncbi:MAG: FAD-dependent oxidoreductase, partial [Variibacter sp.]|nr:FAD-dependent oxidoreductase [Variibacter sp.]